MVDYEKIKRILNGTDIAAGEIQRRGKIERYIEEPITAADVLAVMEQAAIDGLYMESLQDLRSGSDSDFCYCLSVCGQALYKYTDYLKYKPAINNKLNPEKLLELLEIYINLCRRFNKVPSIIAFSYFCGTSNLSMHSAAIDEPLNPAGDTVRKIIAQARLQALNGRIQDGRQNPVGCIAILNHEFGYSREQQESTGHKKVLSIEDLRGILSATQGRPPILTEKQTDENGEKPEK